MPVSDANDVRAILEEIERAGLSLRGIDVRKPNLEEVFLKLTEAHRADDRGRGCRMTPRIIAANLGVRLRSFYREKSAMFFTFAFPVILVLVFGTIFTTPEHLNLDLPVQDLSRSEASARLLEALAADQTFRITQVPADVDATQYAREHKQNLVLVIPRTSTRRRSQAARRAATPARPCR